MKGFATVLILVMLAAPLAATDLTGRWSLDLLPDFSGNDDNIGCSFVQEGEKLTANCGSGPNILGEVKGSKVTFFVKTGRQNEITATFVGELDEPETTISGTWELPDGAGKREGKFRAKKIGVLFVFSWQEMVRESVSHSQRRSQSIDAPRSRPAGWRWSASASAPRAGRRRR